MKRHLLVASLLLPGLLLTARTSQAQTPDGFVPLFDGKSFSGWTVPEGDNGHWKIVDGVIDYDASSASPKDKNLWTTKEYGDFDLVVEWRIKDTPYINPRVPIIKPDGTHKLGADGKEIQTSVPDSDSGILLRGEGKSQINIWCWPIGSGEIYGYRMDRSQPAEVQAGATPRINADHDIGQWNRFDITMRGDQVSVKLNGHQVVETQLPGIPSRGRIGLQHHGGKDKEGNWNSPPSLLQFRNIAIKERG
ncbi:MAG: 3-keto-disaccharide hydrolase [Pirellulaceae bacterium]